MAAARRLGVELVVASEGAYSLVPEVADGLRVDFDDPESSLVTLGEAHRARPVRGVIAADDTAGELAGRFAAQAGLAHNPAAAARVARRKDLGREALARAGLPVPRFRRVHLDRPVAAQVDGIGFPCVVKPLAMAASRGVIRADDGASLRAALRRTGAIVAGAADPEERNVLLVESYLPGMEIAVEGLLTAGRLDVLAVFDKPDPLEGPYFEETYYVTPSRLPAGVRAAAIRAVGRACAAYGLREGPVHAELRISGAEVHVLEVAARTIGGDCARLLRFGTGQALEEIVVAHALGRPVDLAPGRGAAGVLMIPVPAAGTLRRVEGVLAAGRVPGVEDVVIAVREGYEVVPLPEGGAYLGFVFARGETPAAVESALRRANDLLEVVVAPAWRLAPGGAR